MDTDTQTQSLDRRSSILDAAQNLFLTQGYTVTTIAQIGRASGATTGSIYYAFNGKAAIATEIWQAAMADRTDILSTAKKSNKGVQTHIKSMFEAAAADRAIFDFCLQLEQIAAIDPEFTELSAAVTARRNAHKAAYKKWAKATEVRPIAWSVADALINGPALTYLRAGGAATPETAEVFAMCAWRAVKA